MSTGYKCSGCKNNFYGDPVWINATGKYCASCKEKTILKMRTSLDERFEKLDGTCKYCGDVRGRHETWEDKTGCPKCIAWRDRSLKLIRHSDAAFKYMQKTEEKECQQREARIKKEKEEKERVELEKAQQRKPEPEDKQESRLDRLEKLLTKMVTEYGIKLD